MAHQARQISRAIHLLLTLSIVPLGSPHLKGQSLGRVFGVVINQSGSPVAGAAVVWFGEQPIGGVSTTSQNQSLGRGFETTDSQGYFSVNNLSPGSYTLCVTAPSYISSCEWRRGQLHATIVANEAVHLSPVLGFGRTVTIQITDALGRLDLGHFGAVVASGDGSFARARVLSTTANEIILSAITPVSTDLMLNLESSLPLADSSGSLLQTGIPILPVKGTAADIKLAFRAN